LNDFAGIMGLWVMCTEHARPELIIAGAPAASQEEFFDVSLERCHDEPVTLYQLTARCKPIPTFHPFT
jgi:hypothetical protein